MAANDAVAAPPLDADPVLLVDWLELTAFFAEGNAARLDEIDNAYEIQDEEAAEDDGDADAVREARRAAIEQEITERSEGLGVAYPFMLSDDGEELSMKPRGERPAASFYLLCLVLSHVTRSPILLRTPNKRALAQVRRRQFQALSTLAVAGHIGGPAVSFGWPRASGETIVEAVDRACRLSQTGSGRNPPGPVARKYAKDGGMDVIGWRPAVDGNPPPQTMCFGQAASGQGWNEKSAVDEQEDFLESYYLDRPACNYSGVTVIPFRLGPDDHATYGRRHGHILDRLRTPKAACDGLRLARVDGVPIDEEAAVVTINSWLLRYRAKVRAAA